MAPKGDITPSAQHQGAFKVVFAHGSRSFNIEPFGSEEEAALAADVLSIKEALDAATGLESLQLYSEQGPPNLGFLSEEPCSHAAASRFTVVVSQLGACAELVAEGGQADPSGRALVCSAVGRRQTALLALLLAAAPAAAAGTGMEDSSPLESAVLAATVHNDSRPLQLLLSALPDPAAAVEQLDIRLLHNALLDCKRAAQLLLSTAPGAALRTDKDGWTALHAASEEGKVEAARRLLAAAPQATEAVTGHGQLPLHIAAAHSKTGVLRLLLAASPAAATTPNDCGQVPAHIAANTGSAPCLQALLAVAPEAASSRDIHDMTPLHVAANFGCLEATRLLLAAAPAAALMADHEGDTPLAVAALVGHAEVLAELLAAVPEAAHSRSNRGWLPIMEAAANSHLSCLELLLSAAPDTALARTDRQETALSLAAFNAQPAAVSFLAAAAPAAAVLENEDGETPLELVIAWVEDTSQLPAVVRLLLPFGSGERVLEALDAGGDLLLPLFADFVACRPPLSEAEWALIPSPCPALGRALPASLTHSPEQAVRLVSHLPAADAERLRLFALCLHRAQCKFDAPLPQLLVWRILALFDA